jgi:lysophospholipase L1-like esterase
MRIIALLSTFLLVVPGGVAGQQVSRVEREPAHLKLLPIAIHGRVEARGGGFVRQWPGTYFETAFRGSSAMFRVGPGKVSLRIRLDGGRPLRLVKPSPGLYRLDGFAGGLHRLRIDVASENQDAPTVFGGFFAPAGVTPQPVRPRSQAIEFIGDSHTVGYGNTSNRRQCTEEEVWTTTDASQGIGPRLAAHYGADYAVNAISGRGIVRNYNGFVGDTLPRAYPYVLFDDKRLYQNARWRPQLIVIALGGNDFSTSLNAGEKWKSREALRRDFEATYVSFVKALRSHNPRAYILMWIAETGDGETTSEVSKVAEHLRRSGETRLGFVPIHGLELTGCNYHPSLRDDETVARILARFIDSQRQVWRAR